MTISLNGLASNNPLDCLKLFYAVNPKKLQNLFANVKINVENEKDLEMMAKIVENKADVTGALHDPQDETRPLVFDCMRIIHAIDDFTPEEREFAKTLNYTK